MTTPPRGVFAITKAVAFGPRQHPLDPATQPLGGLGARLPERRKHAQDEVSIDRLHRQVRNRLAISCERHPPLRGVLLIAPRRFVRLEISVDALAEGH